jgi:hypothetical protein
MQSDFKLPKKPAKAGPKPKPAVPASTEPDEPIETIVMDDGEPEDEPIVKSEAKDSRPQRLVRWWKSLDRNVRFGVIAAGLVVFCAACLGVYYFTQPKSSPSLDISRHPKKVVKPITIASPLTGVQVDPKLAGRPVTGIMIENSDFARPQSGLQAAGVVYEAIAEAGITRFLALFQESAPGYIGPVRSLRPYYIDYAAPYQASIVHVGGSPDALKEVRSGDFRDLDQFFNSGAFWRISSRAAPHNVYTSFSKLDKLEKSKGYTKSEFVGWPRKADAKLATPTAKSIDLAISGPDYHVHYAYNSKSNSYLRSEGGDPHYEITASNKRVQISPKVVIALVVPLSNGELDASGAYYSNYRTSGSGVAYVFQDGGITKGTWTKEGTEGQLQLTDPDGHELKLNAGQTWVTLVSGTGQIKYHK